MLRAFIFLLLISAAARIEAAETATVKPPEPEIAPPLPPSPVDQFRRWLRLPADGREKALSTYPESKRAVLRAKLAAYDALPAEERERRLKMLDLRWYMRPLMSMPPQSRAGTLKLVPEKLRPIVTERLERWDILPPPLQQEMLAGDESRELVTRYFSQLRRGESAPAIMASMTPGERTALERSLREWNETSAADRQKMGAQLAGFFELPKEQQAKTLGEFSGAEYQEMQKTLEAFSKLSPEQRHVCVESFQKFTMMSPAERAQFLRNAARWQAMTPQERETWKQLVMKLPPLPPLPDESMPPMPRADSPPGLPLASTNSGNN